MDEVIEKDLAVLEKLEIQQSSNIESSLHGIDLSNKTIKEVIRVGEKLQQFVFVEGHRRNKIVLVAHADTCWDMLGHALSG